MQHICTHACVPYTTYHVVAVIQQIIEKKRNEKFSNEFQLQPIASKMKLFVTTSYSIEITNVCWDLIKTTQTDIDLCC